MCYTFEHCEQIMPKSYQGDLVLRRWMHNTNILEFTFYGSLNFICSNTLLETNIRTWHAIKIIADGGLK